MRYFWGRGCCVDDFIFFNGEVRFFVVFIGYRVVIYGLVGVVFEYIVGNVVFFYRKKKIWYNGV